MGVPEAQHNNLPLGATSLQDLFANQHAFLAAFKPTGDVEANLTALWLGIGASESDVAKQMAVYMARGGDRQRQMLSETRATFVKKLERAAFGLAPHHISVRDWHAKERAAYTDVLNKEVAMIDQIAMATGVTTT